MKCFCLLRIYVNTVYIINMRDMFLASMSILVILTLAEGVYFCLRMEYIGIAFCPCLTGVRLGKEFVG